MVNPTDTKTEHIKDQKIDTNGYSEHENIKMKAEFANLIMWVTIK